MSEVKAKFDVRNLNLHYGAFHALKDINMKIGQNEIQTSYTTDTEDILKIFQRICDNSVYSYQNQICNRIYYYKGWP